MVTKIINTIKSIFTPSKQGSKDCDHSNKVSKTVKYCLDCKLVLDES